jgi:hypothetical protein
MKTNDLKTGDKVVLDNGWDAEIRDNKKGNIRMALVHGFVSEIGNIYAHDIAWFLPDNKKFMVEIEHTPAQLKFKQQITRMGF